MPADLIGTAGARRALAVTNEALFVNPAGVAMAPVYSVELGYGDDFRGSDRRFHVSITDGQAGPIAGGLSFTYTTARPRDSTDDSERLEGFRVDGAVALRANQALALGFGVRGTVYDLETDDESTDESQGTLTFDFGLQWRISEFLVLGLVGRNLTNPDEAETPLEAGGGLGVINGPFSIEVDAYYDNFLKNVVIASGSTYVINRLIPVRLGSLYDAAQNEFGISGGLGIQYGRVGLDIGYQQRVRNADDSRDDDERIFTVNAFLQPF
ncbi:MAG: hypothetical protein ACFB9M_15945 [Myxococcota bacterium]